MAGLQEYKCPCCGGAINFDSSIQKMKCPYCDTEFEMETLASYDEALSSDGQDEMNWNEDRVESWQAGEADDMRVYVCKSCGGQIVGDANMAASSCPFCDNPIVVMGQVAGDLKPEKIIPFKLDKAAAKAKYLDHLKGKKLLPKVFRDQNHIDEIKGIYVPYWLFDSKTDAKLRFRGTTSRTWEDDEYDYTETKYYAIFRSGMLAFEHVPADGSSKMDDTLMESIEPFDFKEAVDFQTAYFAGYLADRYDVTAEQNVERTNERVRNQTIAALRDTITGYDDVSYEGGNIKLSDAHTMYAMYPVWLLNTTWNGQKYVFAMNGQTGKFVGDLPCDKGLATAWFFKTFGIATVIAFVVATLFNIIF